MSLKIYRRDGGKIWHYRGSVNGQRLRGSTSTTDKTKAKRKVSKIEEDTWKSDIDGPQTTLTFAQAAFLYRQAEKSDRFLEPIEDYWRDTPVKTITDGAIRQSSVSLYPNVAAATRNRQVIVPTQAIINHAASMNLCTRITVPRFKIEKKEKAPATWPWVSAFMDHSSAHLGALCCFMFLTAARISEALDLRWKDIDFEDNTALIRETKVAKERIAHLPPVLVAAIADIQGDREPDEKVFKYSSRDTAKPQWRKVIKRAGIKYLSYHSCRHGFATSLLHKGIDPITVARLGGWEDATHVLKTYGHAMQDNTLANIIVGDAPKPAAASDTNLIALEKLARN
ncbi:MAG: site-specific integrase [Stappiaceae bacterium]